MNPKRILKSVKNFLNVIPFVGIRQATQFLSIGGNGNRESNELIDIKILSSNRTIKIRKKSFIDRDVFRYVFHNKYHRAPIRLRPDAVIFDLGANIGLSAFDLKIQYPGAQIVAAEMDRDNYEIAKQNLDGFSNVKVINRAIWFENKVLYYRMDTDEDAYQLDASLSSNSPGIQSIETIDIGTLMSSSSAKIVDFIKLDIEGAENEVLTKNNEWLSKVGCINAEIHEPSFFDTAYRTLTEYGFEVKRDTNHWSAILAKRTDYESWSQG